MIKEDAAKFYGSLRKLMPSAVVVAVQAETRFYSEGNRFLAPTGDEYRAKRHSFNRFLEALQYRKVVDRIMMLGGTGEFRFDRGELYRPDGVHLNRGAIDELWGIIGTELDFVGESVTEEGKVAESLARLGKKIRRREASRILNRNKKRGKAVRKMIEGIRNQGNQPKSREGNDNKGVGERGTQAKLGEWDDYVESEEVQYW